MQQTQAFLELHQAFIDKQTKFATYRINNMNIITLPNVYHPAPGSSSLFLLNPIRERYQHLKTKKKRLLELGCGTGVVGLSLGEYVEELYLSDIADCAVLCARINTFINSRKAKIYHSDLFKSLPDILFDVILFNVPLLDKPIESIAEVSTNDPSGKIFLNFIEQVPQYLAPQGEIFFSYSTLGDVALLNKIPPNFNVEKIAEERHEASKNEKYIFRLTIN
ncbi:MAG: methyltransferase [Microcoleus sp. PH2017_10_PVI_O_A]|uniref:methyltransferase n=1 Tax=unclassified Microcoleus TaxID=2642155 RepID=UPI001DAE2DD6|nr:MULTISPECIES: methyltransferase [unclassified Microcoleus]TAE84615.1 MAG: methyltransferase domain-containing protein [Oscillatoriales cyanobacterium]MCC3405077.1 methyltransferase [Microcoleus sp. PH2017_10_PVI_O_A]MCC3459171.1 methyltransferase [Microcoleus sp. PH2017_11_PCY_U_A]MCC3477320.1 methyltransferase [Microcoleus sp. PH2017_12_PCY_D_A]MCC3527631.1 methyltransferase [Microcoleus sp. PH2017_21_RUC_O_A]